MITNEDTVPCRTLACPRCGCAPDRLVEVLRDFTSVFDYENGRRSEKGFHGEGLPHKVIAKCPCGHKWTLRGVRQITDLDVITPTHDEQKEG